MGKDLFERLSQAKRLPSPPGVALRVLELAQRDDASLGEIASAISSDPVLSAKILKFVNSPLAGAARQVSSLNQAIGLMGLRAVKLMALSFSLVSTGRAGVCDGFDFDRFWSKSLACAVAARILARESRTSAAEESFIAGLLSDIGRLVLASGVPDAYAKVLAEAHESGRPLAEIEHEHLGTTHAQVGTQLLEHWRLPESLCQAMGGLHDPDSMEGADETVVALSKVVCTARLAATIICGSDRDRERAMPELTIAVGSVFGWHGDAWETIFGSITTQWQEYGQILSVQTAEVPSFADIQAEAQERIAELSLATHFEARRVEARNDDLLKKATTDALTAVANRAAFDETLESEVCRADHTGRPLTLILMDIDRFKVFNDTYGHQAGDAVLKSTAAAIRDCVRKVDLVARYGGEELAVVAPGCPPSAAVRLGERLRSAVESAILDYDGQCLKVTISVGVIVYATPDGSRGPAELIRAADRLLYRAKDAGRNNVKSAAFRSAPTTEAKAAAPAEPAVG